MAATKQTYNIITENMVIPAVTVKADGELVHLRGVGKREWFKRTIRKDRIVRKVKVSS